MTAPFILVLLACLLWWCGHHAIAKSERDGDGGLGLGLAGVGMLAVAVCLVVAAVVVWAAS